MPRVHLTPRRLWGDDAAMAAKPTIIDARELLDEDEALPADPKARRRALRVAQCIAVGGPLRPGFARQTLLECRRRPGGSPCSGLVWTIKSEDDVRIIVVCPVCGGEEMDIEHYDDTPWAHGPMEPVPLRTLPSLVAEAAEHLPELQNLVMQLDGLVEAEQDIDMPSPQLSLVEQRSNDDALYEAQQVIYEAFEARTPKSQAKLARKALSISKDCADAYLLLGDLAKSPEEALELYEQAVAAGERALGPRVFEEDVGMFWGIVETRPYMRARQALAMQLWQLGQPEAAREQMQDLLRLNPNDNQGVRDVLAALLLELDDDDALAALLDEYGEDSSAVWAWTRVLLEHRRNPRSRKLSRLLDQALGSNRHVPDYLLRRKPLPSEPPDLMTMGGETEAIAYVYDHLAAWERSPQALDWLRSRI